MEEGPQAKEKLEKFKQKKKKNGFSLQSLERTIPKDPFQSFGLQWVKEQIGMALSHCVCGHLLQQRRVASYVSTSFPTSPRKHVVGTGPLGPPDTQLQICLPLLPGPVTSSRCQGSL